MFEVAHLGHLGGLAHVGILLGYAACARFFVVRLIVGNGVRLAAASFFVLCAATHYFSHRDALFAPDPANIVAVVEVGAVWSFLWLFRREMIRRGLVDHATG